MIKRPDLLWAGTEASLSDYVDALTNVEAFSPPQSADEDEEVPYLVDVQGDIAVVKVHGPLTNRDAWYNRYAGITSYNSIREAMLYAAHNPDVKQILLDINSGGGSVSGVADTGNLISLVNDRVKPVTAFTDGNMLSAAYWLGSSAGRVYASKTAMVGSIGVIATHMEQSEALKKAGIGVTVMRAGKYKALANGVEPLTEEAKAQMQVHLDSAYKVFVQHVAEARNVSYDLADSQMAQGREFMGESAVGAGLAEGIMSYDEIFNALLKESIDASENLIDNSRKSSKQEWGMGKKALSETEIAALAEGGLMAGTADALEVEAGATAAVVEGAAGDAESLKGEGVADEGAQASGADDAQAGTAAPAPAPAADTGVVEYLKTQVKEKDDALVTAQVALASVEKELTALKAAHGPLIEIAGRSASNMQVALGGSALNISGMSAEQVLAEHTRVSALFTEKFKAGGVAAVIAAQPKKSEQAVDALTRARLNAAMTTK